MPEDIRVAERLMMIPHVGNRPVDGLAPIDFPVGIERAVRLFFPRDQILARRQHHLLVALRVFGILAGVE